jgi:hypothetical protein
MADHYSAAARSQLAAFEATHPAVLEAARDFDDAPVLVVEDLGAADAVNSHGLIRALSAVRRGRPLVYSLVDLPTNAWTIAARHIANARHELLPDVPPIVLPSPGEVGDGVADVGTGAHFTTASAHARAIERATRHAPLPALVITMVGIPLHLGPSLPPGSAHIAVSGTAMHWVADSGALASTGSVFPGYRDHVDASERTAWRTAAARDWSRLLSHRAAELAPGGLLVIAMPASSRPWPDGDLVYREVNADMNAMLVDWHRQGRIGSTALAALQVPTWQRTRDEIEAPFGGLGGEFNGLVLEDVEFIHLDNPYRSDDPRTFAREYTNSIAAWLLPLLVRAFGLESADAGRALAQRFLGELEDRVTRDPERYRWDYTEALITCRRAGRLSEDEADRV